MAKSVSGVVSQNKVNSLTYNGAQVDTKAEVFAKTFSEVSSDANYSAEFKTHRADIETNNTILFQNSSPAGSEKTKDLNESFALHELQSAIRQAKQ